MEVAPAILAGVTDTQRVEFDSQPEATDHPRPPALAAPLAVGSPAHPQPTIRIEHGDARALPLADGEAALVVTSPPYNVGISYLGSDDRIPWAEYRALVYGSVAEMHRVLMDHGRVFLNVQPAVPLSSDPKDRRRYNIGQLWDTALAQFFEFRDVIVWTQDSWDAACAWGSWLRPSAPNLRGGHELIYVYSKGEWARPCPPQWKGWKGEREGLGGNWEELCRNCWRLKPVPRNVGPAPFPIELPARAIRLSTYPDDLVVDPFCGRGSTVLAAAELGRRVLGVDLGHGEVEAARRALADARESAA